MKIELTKELARAIIDAQNASFSAGTCPTSDAWVKLIVRIRIEFKMVAYDTYDLDDGARSLFSRKFSKFVMEMHPPGRKLR